METQTINSATSFCNAAQAQLHKYNGITRKWCCQELFFVKFRPHLDSSLRWNDKWLMRCDREVIFLQALESIRKPDFVIQSPLQAIQEMEEKQWQITM